MEASFARSMLLHAPMPVLAVDSEGRVRSANATAETFFGGPLTGDGSLAIGELLEGWPPEGREVPDLYCSTLAADSAGERVTARRRDGRSVAVSVQTAQFTAQGQIFFTVFIHDLTDALAAEAAVRQLRVQLNHSWRLSSFGEMASMLAHELNQPLAAVANQLHAARVLLDRDEADLIEARSAISAAEVQAQRCAESIRHLRALVARDTGFQKHELIADVVGEITPVLSASARDFNAELVVDIPPGDEVQCDRVQLQQVVGNLVRNAFEAPENEHARRVTVSGRPCPGGGYLMQVEDNGPGVPPEVRETLFRPLTSTKLDGMGLGLSICRTIVESHGGQIAHLHSALGGVFALTLNASLEQSA